MLEPPGMIEPANVSVTTVCDGPGGRSQPIAAPAQISTSHSSCRVRTSVQHTCKRSAHADPAPAGRAVALNLHARTGMKTFIVIALLAAGTAAAAGYTPKYRVTVWSEARTDFSKIRTYSWMQTH